jgi:predicted alpha/beta-fold hydrolase
VKAASYLLDPSFQPAAWLRGRHTQSILPSLPLRRRNVEQRARALIGASRELLIDCGAGVRLAALHAPALGDAGSRAPLVILLHGWEGSAQSLYVLSLGQLLFERGYEIVRLNLRDHGETQHLNRGLFHSCRLAEVVGAVSRLRADFPQRPLLLAGFSLGGNFMLRVAAEAQNAQLELRQVFAVSPVLDPASTLDALEEGLRLYHSYFVLKWSSSLRRKQQLWPEDYEFGPMLRSRNLRQMTADLVAKHTEYQSLRAYLRGYAITEERLTALQVPTTIIVALDDPIIPAADLARLAPSAALRVVATLRGGHCGFVESLDQPSWVDRFILREAERVAPPG